MNESELVFFSFLEYVNEIKQQLFGKTEFIFMLDPPILKGTSMKMGEIRFTFQSICLHVHLCVLQLHFDSHTLIWMKCRKVDSIDKWNFLFSIIEIIHFNFGGL